MLRTVKELIIQIVKNMCCSYINIMIKLSHNFTHGTTAELAWHVQNWELIGSWESISKAKKSRSYNYRLKHNIPLKYSAALFVLGINQ